MRRLTAVWLVLLLGAGSAFAGINTYTNEASWVDALYTPVNTINWDNVDLADGSQTIIAGDLYTTMPGSPNLSVGSTGSLYVIDPDSDSTGFFGSDFYPVSGDNVFAPDGWPEPSAGPEGILTITFSRPVYGLSVWFLDVENDFDSTGIEILGEESFFGTSQGDNSKSFLGIVSDIPFLSARIHMSSDPGGNGVGIDDLNYALVPVPAAVVLGMLGLGVAGLKLRKYV